jgi:hypothetical protein
MNGASRAVPVDHTASCRGQCYIVTGLPATIPVMSHLAIEHDGNGDALPYTANETPSSLLTRAANRISANDSVAQTTNIAVAPITKA